jgi:hypothetical protein
MNTSTSNQKITNYRYIFIISLSQKRKRKRKKEEVIVRKKKKRFRLGHRFCGGGFKLGQVGQYLTSNKLGLRFDWAVNSAPFKCVFYAL